MNTRPEVIVVGAGVAGISAALCLAEQGANVQLLEQRALPGGRAGSLKSPLGHAGLLDNCQHVLLGCCTELQSLYRRLGAEHLIRFDTAIHFAERSGKRARMKPVPLPSPLHLGPSLLGFSWLSTASMIEIAAAMMSMYALGQKGREAWHDRSFLQLLRHLNQSPETIHDYWDVIAVSALNELSSDVSAKYGLQVFQESFLARRDGYRLGYARSPLSELYAHIPGVQYRLGVGVRSLQLEGHRVSGVVATSGERLQADHVILATNPGNAIALLKPIRDWDEQFARLEQLQFRAILGVHLRYDRPIDLPYPVAFLGTKLQWVFPDAHRPELLHGVVSAADLLPEGADLPTLFDGEIRLVLGRLQEARLVDHLVVKETRATFRAVPGIDAIRPSQRTSVAGLTLAGDYTRTNWPATMEGAARSGRLAAEAVLTPDHRPT